MTSRYANREIKTNLNSKYTKLFLERNINFITQYNTPDQKYPTSEEIGSLTRVSYVWSIGDRFYKLADEFYGDPALWWIIAWYNNMPTEAHAKIGYVIDIPLPLEEILRLWDK